MSQQYDTLSEQYDGVKLLPVGLAEQATVLTALPDLAGASVLDVGTGTGFYPRLFTRMGARHVVGVDTSPTMIAQARRIEVSTRLGISYEIHDATTLPTLGEFDVVTAVWLLGYAEDEHALDRMLANLTANLADGATLVALVPNPDFAWDRLDACSRYGLTIAATDVARGRQGSVVTFHTDPPFTIEGRTWPPGAIESALRRAGLTVLRRHPVSVPADTSDGHGHDYWADLMTNPTFAVFSGVRAGLRPGSTTAHRSPRR
jgi:SAM-dependent methyltransferase